MLETNRPTVEKWKGLKANLALTLHQPGEFSNVEGVLNFEYHIQRAHGKKTLLRSTKAVLGISQISTSLIFQTEDDLLIYSIEDILVDPSRYVYDGAEDNFVTDNAEIVYA